LGIGDWGLGIGDWAIPNPQSPIPIVKVIIRNKRKNYTINITKIIINIQN